VQGDVGLHVFPNMNTATIQKTSHTRRAVFLPVESISPSAGSQGLRTGQNAPVSQILTLAGTLIEQGPPIFDEHQRPVRCEGKRQQKVQPVGPGHAGLSVERTRGNPVL
jgi:hypothetical protein